MNAFLLFVLMAVPVTVACFWGCKKLLDYSERIILRRYERRVEEVRERYRKPGDSQ